MSSKIKVVFLLFTLLSLALSKSNSDIRKDYWEQFKADFDKSFDSDDDETISEMRFWINMKTIVHQNFEYRRGRTTFKIGINEFADETIHSRDNQLASNESLEQRKPLRLRLPIEPIVVFRGSKNSKEQSGSDENSSETHNLPVSFDWRDHGAVTKVKDQKNCGSCYAFSAVAALESHNFIVNGELIDLSPQEVLDCAAFYDTYECTGGNEYGVFEYVRDNGGISSASSYPYEVAKGKCRSEDTKVELDLKGYGTVSKHEKDDNKFLMEALVEIGPMAISIDMNHESFMRYSGGIFFEDDCIPNDDNNHAALLVGYGNENGLDFWIIKNSFGEKWGEDGYIRVAMNKGGDCGITLLPFYPVFYKKGEREEEENSS